jgi:hypothetical protein
MTDDPRGRGRFASRALPASRRRPEIRGVRRSCPASLRRGARRLLQGGARGVTRTGRAGRGAARAAVGRRRRTLASAPTQAPSQGGGCSAATQSRTQLLPPPHGLHLLASHTSAHTSQVRASHPALCGRTVRDGFQGSSIVSHSVLGPVVLDIPTLRKARRTPCTHRRGAARSGLPR